MDKTEAEDIVNARKHIDMLYCGFDWQSDPDFTQAIKDIQNCTRPEFIEKWGSYCKHDDIDAYVKNNMDLVVNYLVAKNVIEMDIIDL
jgi:hypothetical protein